MSNIVEVIVVVGHFLDIINVQYILLQKCIVRAISDGIDFNIVDWIETKIPIFVVV